MRMWPRKLQVYNFVNNAILRQGSTQVGDDGGHLCLALAACRMLLPRYKPSKFYLSKMETNFTFCLLVRTNASQPFDNVLTYGLEDLLWHPEAQWIREDASHV